MKKFILVILLCLMSACSQSDSNSSDSILSNNSSSNIGSSNFNTDSNQSSSILTSDSIGSSSSINSSDSSNQDTKYLITFDKQDGTGGSDSVEVSIDDPMPAATKPTKDEHNFLGYFDSATSGVQYYTATMTSARNWDKSSGATLYAHWERMSYTVTLDKQGGTGGSDSVAVNYGSEMPAATAPSREDNTFLGYYDAKTGGNKYYDANMNSVKNWDKYSGGTLYAQWTDKYLKGLEFYFNEIGFTYNISIGTLTNETEIVIPSTYKGLPVQLITTAGFKNCSNLVKITLPSTIMHISYEAFMNCEKLASINIPENVETVGKNAFFNTKIWNDASENSIVHINRWVVGYKGNINSKVIKDDTIGIAASAFADCQSITSIIIPNSVVYINPQAFYNCQELTSIILSKNLTGLSSQTFYDCSKLANIDIPDSVVSIYDAFKGTKFWNDSPDNDVIYADKWLVGFKGVITNVVVKEGTVGVANGSLSNSSILSALSIPASVKYFYNPFVFSTGVTEINVAADNPYFSSLDGNLYNKDKTILMNYAVGKNDATFIIPKSVKTIGFQAFMFSKLTSINIPKGVTKLEQNAFYYSNNLQVVTFDDGSQLETIGQGAFIQCAFSEIRIPASVKIIDTQAISGCSSLVSVIFESGSRLEKIGFGAFSSCPNLVEISIPNSVWFIGQSAFNGAKKIASITIHSNITYIGSYAFSGWTNSQKIYIKGYLQAPSSWDANWNQGSSAIIYWGQ